MKTLLLLLSLALFGNELTYSRQVSNIKSSSEGFESQYKTLVKKHGLITLGIAVIKNGKVIWTGYFGEESPGKPASENTLFDVASITKTVSTEAFLKLVDQNKISLTESMSNYWIDPDLEKSSKLNELTLYHTLTHTTGFRNWRFFDNDNTLKFINNPGTIYGYSGEGFEYGARYIESKLDTKFDELVQNLVFNPLNISKASISVQKDLFSSIARPIDENGKFYGFYCRPNGWCRGEGEYSAAGDLVISVEDYAKFMISVMNGSGYSIDLIEKRNQVHTETNLVDCKLLKHTPCPEKQGYGLGWRVLDYKNNKLITHGGSDWSEIALAYFYEASKDGVVIFINAPAQRGLNAMPEAIEIIEPNSPMAVHYRMRLGRN